MPISFFVGVLFGIGLMVSGMCRRTKIVGFLTINDNWDPSLILVMGGAIAVNLLTFHYIIRVRKSAVLGSLDEPGHGAVDCRLITGAALFGLGWGIGGLCPGPGMIDFFTLSHCILWIPSLAIG